MGSQLRREVAPTRLRRAVVVDDEPEVLQRLERWLGTAGWMTVCVSSPDGALRAVREGSFDLAIIDYRLNEADEGIRLGRTILRRYGLPFILISGYLRTPLVVEALRAGALDVLDKPLSEDRFLSLVEGALSRANTSPPNLIDPSRTMLRDDRPGELRPPRIRWAGMMLGICGSYEDPRTVQLWGQIIGRSPSTIEETCYLCNVRTQDSKDLARFLRAISQNRHRHDRLDSFFSIADERTFDRLFRRANLARDAKSVPLRGFLINQTFISTSEPCLHELAHQAANSPFFF